MHKYEEKVFGKFKFHVVHKQGDTLNSAVSGSDDETMAKADAQTRTERARELNLSCSYVVCRREDGEAMKAAA